TTSHLESDGAVGNLKLDVRALSKPDSVLWTLDEEANQGGAVTENIYATWMWGCCGSASAYRAYNLKTGKLIVKYDDRMGTSQNGYTQPCNISVPNSDTQLRRVVGIISADAARDFEVSEGKNG